MEVTVERGADGIVYVTYPTEMDEETITRYLINLEKELKNSPAKAKILTDTTKCKTVEHALIKKIADGVAPLKIYIEKSAIIISGVFQKAAADLIFLVSKRFDIKAFNNRDDALTWLNEK
ncbi:MAG: hypothetical protein K6U80_17575 [Firmicutes bacterium]|nr:hypothetical protein [Bacillota bacterium]